MRHVKKMKNQFRREREREREHISCSEHVKSTLEITTNSQILKPIIMNVSNQRSQLKKLLIGRKRLELSCFSTTPSKEGKLRTQTSMHACKTKDHGTRQETTRNEFQIDENRVVLVSKRSFTNNRLTASLIFY